MLNQELAEIFREIAMYLEMENVAYKPFAYQKAAFGIESLEKDISEIYKEQGRKGIESIPGVGKSIADKIEEYLKTGKIKYYENYKKKYPVNIEELTSVEGIGSKMVKILYEKLGIKNLKDLELAAKNCQIRNLPGFGEKTEKNILQGIEFLKKSQGRFLLGEILPRVKEIEEKLKKLKEVEFLSVCGSVRRMKETIGDVDFLVVTKHPKKVMDYFCSLSGIEKIWGKGITKSSIRLKGGFDVDLRVVEKNVLGSALLYFTGSKEHNIKLRKIAIEKGYKLNEYGLFKGKKRVASKTEEEIYNLLGMQYIEPEMREDRGEIELALEGKLPEIIMLKDIKGDLHCHSKWNGGADSIIDIVNEALKIGYSYIGISDHTKFLKIEHGLNESQLLNQRKKIDEINIKLKRKGIKIKVLQGAETNIMPDGRIDIKDDVLKKLDYAIAGVHSNFKMKKAEMTERIIKAMKNPYINIISHPTGRILKRRDNYQIDIDKILKAAKLTNTILEINSFPDRLDLNDLNIKRAVEYGVKLIINTDSHQKEQLRFIEYGVAQARRGWAKKIDIVNTYSLHKLLKLFNRD